MAAVTSTSPKTGSTGKVIATLKPESARPIQVLQDANR
jgi:hypothetical protein